MASLWSFCVYEASVIALENSPNKAHSPALPLTPPATSLRGGLLGGFLFQEKIHHIAQRFYFRRLIVSRIKPAHSSKDKAHPAKTIEQNIHTIINIRRAKANQRTTEEHLADIGTNFSGAHVF
jgi:hypothetical protein